MPPTKSLKSAKTKQPDKTGSFMLANGSEPRFPEDILIAPRSLPGAAIADAPEMPTGKEAIAAGGKPAARKPSGKADKPKTARRVRKPASTRKSRPLRKPKRNASGKTADRAKVGRKSVRLTEGSVAAAPPAGQSEAPLLLLTYLPPEPVPAESECATAGSPAMPPPPIPAHIPMPLRPIQPAASLTGRLPAMGPGLSVTFHTVMKGEATADAHAPARPLPDDREPFVPLSRTRAVTRTDDSLISRVVAWLGKLLPRRARKANTPRSRRSLREAQTAVRPSEQGEIDRLRRENKRLRGEIARLAEKRLDTAAGGVKPPAA